MYVYILPVSGGGFVSQLAAVQHLSLADFRPDLTMASSGGNVAAYICSAANWNAFKIQRLALSLRPQMFLKQWTPISFLSSVRAFYESSIYKRGTSPIRLLEEWFTPETIVKDEIWTGTYNKTIKKARLFCNRNRKDSILNIDSIDYDLTQSVEPVFMDGNINLICRVSMASACIPSLIPPELIEGHQYVDGGVASASPLNILQEAIIDHILKKETDLHLFYINSVDLSAQYDDTEVHNILDTWKEVSRDVVTSSTTHDRISAYNLLRAIGGTIRKSEFISNQTNLAALKQIQGLCKATLLEIYPLNYLEINFTNFSETDIDNSINRIYNNISCRLWWIIKDDENINKVHEILAKMKI